MTSSDAYISDAAKEDAASEAEERAEERGFDAESYRAYLLDLANDLRREYYQL